MDKMLLHASELNFIHPSTGYPTRIECDFSSLRVVFKDFLPDKFFPGLSLKSFGDKNDIDSSN